MAIDQEKIAKVKNAMDNRYENKIANIKTNIDGDYSGDTSSYPTAGAVQAYVEGKGYITSHQDISGKEDSSNKVTSWSTTTNNTRYPSEKLVKDSLDQKISTSNVAGLVKNDGTIDTTTYLTEHQDISGKANSADLATVATTGRYTDLTNIPTTFTPSSHAHGSITNDGKIGTVSGKPLITSSGGEITTGSFGTTSGTFAEGNHTHSQYLTSHQSLSDIGGVVTVEKQTTADTGYAHTYVVKQNGSQVGSKINIPKDLLLQSATKEVVGSTPTTLEIENNLTTGDTYLKFVVNTEDNDNATTLIVPINDLVENAVYTAGNGLTLSSGEFSIANGDITLSMLATGVQTSLGYANDWHSSPAQGISSTDISNWNNKSSLSTTDIDARINQALDDLAELIYPTSS